MKNYILLLLLATFSMQAQTLQSPTFGNVTLKNNVTSLTATKVNVQEANGQVNTQTINTGFNKNIGLGGSDVVGANTLLNQYSTTPVDWTATTFASGQVVFYGGKQWISKTATVAGDVPSVSSKWEEITFEALANKTVIVDAIPTDGSNNAVSSNGVFDGLALKANLASPAFTGTPTSPTATAGTNTNQVATTAFVTNGIATADSQNVKLTGDQTISGQKSFSLTGKIDMQTNNAFPAIRVTSLGSNGLAAAEFINNSSSPNSTALALQTSLSGGVGNRTLDVSNISPMGIGIVSSASNGGVSISSQSGNGDSYVSNITSGGTGRNYVGRNNGIETYSVDKIGNVIGKSFVKFSAPTTNLLLAGGGDIAQGTFALASSVHNPVTIGAANGLSLSTQQLSLGLASSGVTGALSGTDWNTFNGKFNTPTGLTTNHLPKWNGSGFVDSLIESSSGVTRISSTTDNVPLSIFSNQPYATIGFKSNTSTNGFNVRLGAEGENFVFMTLNSERLRIKSNGRVLINKTDDDLANQLQVAGTISAYPATTANQVPTWGQVQAIASSGSYTPTLTNNANIASTYLKNATYTKVGNIVTVNIGFELTLTAANKNSSLRVTLPIATASGNSHNVGVGSAVVIGGGGLDNISIFCQGGTTTSVVCNFYGRNAVLNHIGSVTFQYDITQ